MTLQKELAHRIYGQHCLACKVAIVVNLLWAVSNFLIIDDYKWLYVGINILAAVAIAVAMKFRKELGLNAESLGMIPMVATITAFAITYNTIEVEAFRSISYTYVAAFVGAGMFLLWDTRFSLLSTIYAITLNGIMYFAFSPLSFKEYMVNGGLLIITIAIFMIISIQVRYNLVKKEILSSIALREHKKELENSAKKHKVLFEQNPIPMLICSIDNRTVLAVNDMMIDLYGYSRDEFLNMNLRDLFKKGDLPQLESCLAEIIDEQDKTSEWINILKDGSEINVIMVAKTIEYDHRKVRLISVNDITEMKQYEDELIEARKEAEKAKELQSNFLSNMSHEIRTPMNGIIGITEILSKSGLNEEQLKYLKAIKKSSENLMVIINDILDFSKIEAGKMALESTSFRLKDEVQTTCDILSVKAYEKGIHLKVNIDPEIPEKLKGDPVRLNQVLTNIAGNAIKFTEEGGVTIDISKVESSEDRVRLRFVVSDTGIGIEKDKLDRIFDSFTQASNSTTRTHGGTGLGLTISKQLIELQNGQLGISSEPGVGSRFHWDLEYVVPKIINIRKEPIKVVMKPTDYLVDELKGLRVLLVEDHPINQMLALKVLKDWGFKVDLADNGKVGLERLLVNEYDLILMDISMPEMDGYEATKHIRSGHFGNPEIPIIAMTASALIGDNEKCFKVGMDDYVAKPFDPRILLEKIYKRVSKSLIKRA